MTRFIRLDSPLRAAVLASTLVTAVAAPQARAERSTPRAQPDLGALSRAASAGDRRDLARPLRLPGWPSLALDWAWPVDSLHRHVRLWMSRPWPLGLSARQSPATLVALWVTGGVHHLLDWLALPEPSDEALLRRSLDRLTIAPISGAESSPYGYRRDPFTRRRKLHKGVDYKARRGTPVYAAGPGVVRVARRRGGYGRVVMIEHGHGVETRYAHLQRITVRAGQRVAAGARIGTVGSSGRATGPHLHFELRIHDEAHDPHRVLGPLLPRELIAAAR